jgi:outer membrane protein TolC
MKFYATIIVIFLSLSILKAQTKIDSSQVMSLEQCLSYSFEHQQDVKNAELDIQNSFLQKKAAIATGLPQVNGRMQFVNNVEIQKQFLPASAFDQTVPSDLIAPVGFGVPYTNNLTITGQQLIFDGSYLAGVKASQTYIELFSKSLMQTKVDVAENVTKAYYGVLVAYERVKLLSSDEENLEKLISDTRVGFLNGVLEEIDLQRLEVERNNILVQKADLESFKEISYKILKFQMGMAIDEDLLVVADLRELYKEVIADTLPSADYKNRIEYKLLNTQLKVDELNVQYNRAFKMPTLAAFGTLGYNTGAINLGDIPSSSKYEGYGMIGLQLDVPIFSGFAKDMEIGKAKVARMKTEQTLDKFKLSADLEVATSQSEFDVSQKRIKLQLKSVELAKNVQRISQIKYDEGVGSSYELTNAISDATAAESNLYFSVYDALVAYTELKKALGTLYQE